MSDLKENLRLLEIDRKRAVRIVDDIVTEMIGIKLKIEQEQEMKRREHNSNSANIRG